MPNRIGIFGGSFDPVHFGHLLLAESAREQCNLDEVWLIPAAVPPHKQARILAPDRARVEMLQLAIAGDKSMVVSTIETDRGGVSYTVDTLTHVHDGAPEAELFLLIGADTLHDLPNWREPEQVCQLAVPAVVRRAGSPEPDYSVLTKIVDSDRLELFRGHQVEMPLIDFHSTAIRQRVHEGRSIRYLTPRAVEKYIETNRLYVESK